MKKFMAVILVLVFALSFAACGENYTLEGKWKAPVSVVGAGSPGEDNFMMLDFKDDGKGTVTNFSVDQAFPTDFTYVVDGDSLIVTSENGEVVDCEYKIEGDTLTISTGYKTVEYIRFS